MDNLLNSIQKDNYNVQVKSGSIKAETKKDEIKLSDEAKEYNRQGSAVKEASAEINKSTESAKLMKLKNDIAQGTYRVSGEDIAGAMMGLGKKQ